ncbi:hypothetical protein Gohar_020674 [Gossypium harknessii]|uniref:Uncharacterized protein n=1 Tax=Gossypium harknessii TaxID=34285 RepID=A0A7J9I160_9ROSI|nr:hypothetical protein [Gossypium harknessii]
MEGRDNYSHNVCRCGKESLEYSCLVIGRRINKSGEVSRVESIRYEVGTGYCWKSLLKKECCCLSQVYTGG